MIPFLPSLGLKLGYHLYWYCMRDHETSRPLLRAKCSHLDLSLNLFNYESNPY